MACSFSFTRATLKTLKVTLQLKNTKLKAENEWSQVNKLTIVDVYIPTTLPFPRTLGF